jgi:orotate phosphoribosyltransferase-like protein
MFKMATTKRDFGALSAGGGYGWGAKRPERLTELLKNANLRFGRLKKIHQIDAIAFTGSSGAAIAFTLGIKHNIPLIYVRKPGEESHGGQVECNADTVIKSYLIVDDFIDSGNTIIRIATGVNEIAKWHRVKPPVLLGVLCFDPYHSRDSVREFEGVGELPIFAGHKNKRRSV